MWFAAREALRVNMCVVDNMLAERTHPIYFGFLKATRKGGEMFCLLGFTARFPRRRSLGYESITAGKSRIGSVQQPAALSLEFVASGTIENLPSQPKTRTLKGELLGKLASLFWLCRVWKEEWNGFIRGTSR